MASRDKLEETRRPAPRLYLVAPPHAAGLENMLAGSLGVVDIAAVLLRLPASDERGRTGQIEEHEHRGPHEGHDEGRGDHVAARG